MTTARDANGPPFCPFDDSGPFGALRPSRPSQARTVYDLAEAYLDALEAERDRRRAPNMVRSIPPGVLDT